MRIIALQQILCVKKENFRCILKKTKDKTWIALQINKFHILLEDVPTAKTRNRRRVRNGREEMKPSLFQDDTTFYIENPSA